MFKTRFVTLAVVLVLMPMARFGTAGTDYAAIPLKESVSMTGDQYVSTNQNKAPVSSSHAILDVCFDVQISELIICQVASKPPVRYYRTPPDVCFDVPISERISCQAESQATALSYSYAVDECFDVPISELISCQEASSASSSILGQQ